MDNLFPIKELSSETLVKALHNLNERLTALEARPISEINSGDGGSLSGRDRAVLDEAAGFFGVHSVVANTLESKSSGVQDIDPNTGLSRVIVERPNFQRTELQQTGS